MTGLHIDTVGSPPFRWPLPAQPLFAEGAPLAEIVAAANTHGVELGRFDHLEEDP